MAQTEEYVYMSCICTGYEEASRNDVLQIAVRDDAGKTTRNHVMFYQSDRV